MNNLLIAAGQECTSRIIADPRTHSFLKSTLQEGGSVATMDPLTQNLLPQLNIQDTDSLSRLYIQNGEPTDLFIRKVALHFAQ